MPKFHIVTDDAATFSPVQPAATYPLTVVPNRIIVDGQAYRAALDIPLADLRVRMMQAQEPVQWHAPSVEDYAQCFLTLSAQVDGVVVLLPSRELSESWQNARTAAQQMNGACEIVVIDSQTICAGLGMLVSVAGAASLQAHDMDELVQITRGAVERVFATYYVETLGHLQRHGIMSDAHSILGTLLGIKPFLSIEDGRLLVTEKVRNHPQAIERLVEFLVEFEELDDAVIVHYGTHVSEQLMNLQERLTTEFPERHFSLLAYSVPLATLLGYDGIGLVVLESEWERFLDDD